MFCLCFKPPDCMQTTETHGEECGDGCMCIEASMRVLSGRLGARLGVSWAMGNGSDNVCDG